MRYYIVKVYRTTEHGGRGKYVRLEAYFDRGVAEAHAARIARSGGNAELGIITGIGRYDAVKDYF